MDSMKTRKGFVEEYFLLNSNHDFDSNNVYALDLKTEEFEYLKFLKTKENRKRHWEIQKKTQKRLYNLTV